MRPATFSEARASCHSLLSELYEPREPGLLADVRKLVAKVDTTDHWLGLHEKVGAAVCREGSRRISVVRHRAGGCDWHWHVRLCRSTAK